MRSALRFDTVQGHALAPVSPARGGEYLLYVHIPFCESLCPYCSFHRYVYDPAAAAAYYHAVVRELQAYKNLGFDFTGMYIGGGTPTICMEGLLEVLQCARSLYSIREISVETNPNHLQDNNLSLLKHAGVNRLSVGVQSFDDELLRHIGRYEKYGSGAVIQQQLRQALGVFDTLNIDLIFNLPLQTAAHLRRDLAVIAELLPDQVTFYPLMTAPSVAKTLSRILGPIDYRKEKKYYFMILEQMRSQYTGSTAWCFSRKQSMIDEYIVSYDRYVGVGSGAFGYHNDGIYINTFSLEEYSSTLRAGRLPITRIKKFSDREKQYYFFLMKLFGLSLPGAALDRLRREHCRTALVFEVLALKLLGALRQTGDTITLTDRGKYYWVMAMREFFIAVDTIRDHCRATQLR